MAQAFNYIFRYIDGDLSLNNSRFGLSTSNLSKWAWSWGYYWYSKVCFLPWPSPWNRQRRKIKKKKHERWTFQIVNFPFISGNIPTSPAYGVYISQLIRYFFSVSGIIFIRYTQSQNSWKSNKLKVFGSKKTRGHKTYSQKRLRQLCLLEGKP